MGLTKNVKSVVVKIMFKRRIFTFRDLILDLARQTKGAIKYELYIDLKVFLKDLQVGGFIEHDDGYYIVVCLPRSTLRDFIGRINRFNI